MMRSLAVEERFILLHVSRNPISLVSTRQASTRKTRRYQIRHPKTLLVQGAAIEEDSAEYADDRGHSAHHPGYRRRQMRFLTLKLFSQVPPPLNPPPVTVYPISTRCHAMCAPLSNRLALIPEEWLFTASSKFLVSGFNLLMHELLLSQG